MNYKIKTGKELKTGDVLLYIYISSGSLLRNKTSAKIEKIVTLRGVNLSVWTYDEANNEMSNIEIDPDSIVVVGG